MRKSKAKSIKSYNSIGAFADGMGFRDRDLAEYLRVSVFEANKLRHGKRFKVLAKALRYARKCRVPIENLAEPEILVSQS